ncbi:MAG: type II secretion system protein, partial [Planctomycetales bacterium]|nr:type II secretion system protein [Planctomycetales bacterium]
MLLRRHPGYTLVEVAISTLIVGVLLVAALNTTGYATRGQIDNKQRAQAKLIANAMLAEIL